MPELTGPIQGDPTTLLPGGVLPGGVLPGGVLPGGVLPGGVLPAPAQPLPPRIEGDDEMLLRYLGWTAAAGLVIAGISAAEGAEVVTSYAAWPVVGPNDVKCSEFGQGVISHMG